MQHRQQRKRQLERLQHVEPLICTCVSPPEDVDEARKPSVLIVLDDPLATTATRMAGIMAIERVSITRFHGGSLSFRNPSITNCPAYVPVIVDDCPAASSPIAQMYTIGLPKLASRQSPALRRSMLPESHTPAALAFGWLKISANTPTCPQSSANHEEIDEERDEEGNAALDAGVHDAVAHFGLLGLQSVGPLDCWWKNRTWSTRRDSTSAECK